MCKSMNVSRNSYYNWLKNRDKSNNTLKYLKSRIAFHFKESREIYGSTRIQKKLTSEGLIYSTSYIAKLMKIMGLKSILNPKHDTPIVKNVLNREFYSSLIGEKWVSDITYIQVGNQWNYLTSIIDLADRKVVDWTLSEDMTTENTVIKLG